MLSDQQKALIAEAKDFTHSGNLIATHAWTLIDKLVVTLEASDQPPQCDGFQYPLGDGHKKCNICGTITAHFGRHDKGDKPQPPQLSESDAALIARARDNARIFAVDKIYIDNGKEARRCFLDLALRVEQLAAERDKLSESDVELLREARDGGREFRATQADWELWIVDLKNRLALRVEQLVAELAKLENTFGERLAQGFNKEAEREHAQAMEYKGQLAVKDTRIAALEAERDHLWELNELGKRCVSEAALAAMESNARIAALEKALKFYSIDSNYNFNVPTGDPNDPSFAAPIFIDKGDAARQALAAQAPSSEPPS